MWEELTAVAPHLTGMVMGGITGGLLQPGGLFSFHTDISLVPEIRELCEGCLAAAPTSRPTFIGELGSVGRTHGLCQQLRDIMVSARFAEVEKSVLLFAALLAVAAMVRRLVLRPTAPCFACCRRYHQHPQCADHAPSGRQHGGDVTAATA